MNWAMISVRRSWMGSRRPTPKSLIWDPGTTLSVVEVRDRVARGYQVGDSMALILGQRGAIKWKSTSHSPVGYAIESGMIDEEDAMNHDERHLVSNLVGSREMHIEVGPAIRLTPRDMAKIGCCMLSGGTYNGRQIVCVSLKPSTGQ